MKHLMENKSHALAAGTFVMVVLALLVTLAVWLTRDTRQLQIYELSSQEAVTGLQPQATVRFKGVNVGKVTAIGFDTWVPGHVLIRIAIDDQAPITASTYATLGFQGVTGLAFVQLDDKGESTLRLPAGQEPPSRIPMRAGLLTNLSDQGTRLLSQVEETSRRVNQLLASDNQKTLMTAVANLGQAAASLQQLSVQSSQLLPALVLESSLTLKTMQVTSQSVGESAEEARASARAFRAVTERMNQSGGTLDQLTRGVNILSDTAQTLNAATLPRVNRAIDDTARSARQVSRAASLVNDNPQALIFGNGKLPPGPGEPGFSVNATRP
ncbi:MAG: phospholipid/cholesterol/gamma-HCH transport system substrate-binding protein [Rhodoferax sp.]|jgi:phospholipid/cholesterol/gamma-HCH transport system substrate-binding protein